MTLTLLGDSNVQMRERPEEAFSRLQGEFDKTDVLIGHLEGLFYPPSEDENLPDIPYKSGWRHSDPSQAAAYKAAGFHALCCASNVSYGPEPVLNTIRILDELGIAHAGIGADRVEATRPALVEWNGLRIGLLSYGSVFWPSGHAASAGNPGIATVKANTAYQPGRRALEMPGAAPEIITWPDEHELAEMVGRVQDLRTQVNVLIVSCHWGVSSSPTPTGYQSAIAHAAIDAGADLVFGHHPHVIQPVEIYHDKAVLYSAGNAAFDWKKMRNRHLNGLLLRCDVDDGGVITGVRALPIRRDGENFVSPAPCGSNEGRVIADGLIDASAARFATKLRIEGDEVVIL